MAKIIKKLRTEIKLTEIKEKFGIKAKVTKFVVPSRHSFNTDDEWQRSIYLIIETEEEI